MEFNRKEIIKYTKSLEAIGIKEDKFTEEIIKKFRVSETMVMIFYQENADKKIFNVKIFVFFILGLILITLGIISGTIALLFGLAQIGLSVAFVLQNMKFNKLCKRLLLTKK
ncbi:hypothetical protein [Tamlana sp. I1]|uniref:hypothetical protein n=1 Tax=Tamlana sp. I1 TaxID=2762061 RepID=UPI0018900994|nr:hypothetical protein [Tamlana sp. I1]